MFPNTFFFIRILNLSKAIIQIIKSRMRDLIIWIIALDKLRMRMKKNVLGNISPKKYPMNLQYLLILEQQLKQSQRPRPLRLLQLLFQYQ